MTASWPDQPARFRVAAVFLVVAMPLVALPVAEAAQQESPEGGGALIINGTPINEGDYPFLAYVEIESGGLIFQCGGTLIDAEWVLTAAHCLDAATTVAVGLGSANWNSFSQVIGAAEVRQHPDWIPGGNNWFGDIGLIRLDQPADLTDPNIGTLPLNTSSASPAAGATPTVMGWGDISPAEEVDTPPANGIALETTTTVVACDSSSTYNNVRNVCAAGAGGSCLGDSGGPLVQTIGGTLKVVGVVQAVGAAQGFDCFVGSDIYGRVSFHAAWIQQTTGVGATCASKPVTINMNTNGGNGNGTAGDDVILGTSGPDTINANAGNDTVCGGAGDDTIFGGPGFDLINGQDGNDFIDGGSQGDEIYGAAGNDEINGGEGWDTLRGNEGNDTIRGQDGNDNINGGEGADHLFGNSGHDLLVAWTGDDVAHGGTGDDRVNGQSGNDQLFGGPGDDSLWGSLGDDSMFGEAGFDWLWGGWGSDQLSGGDQGDRLYGEGHNDALDGNNGWDLLVGGFGFDTCNGGAGTDSSNTCESLSGIP